MNILPLLAEFWEYIAGGAVGLAMVLISRRSGAKRFEAKAKEADHERAAEIRDRVERDLPERVHEYDDRGYRD
ncbi:MAG: hypothetical protein AAFN94_00890 [Pseudomonadota bacterium]